MTEKSKMPNITQPSSIYYLTYTLIGVINSVYESVPFNEPEPKKLNRHWAVHGRSHIVYSKEDCMVLFRIIKALNILNNYISSIGELQ